MKGPDWLVLEWVALADDLERQADHLERTAAALRARAEYSRGQAKQIEDQTGIGAP